MISIKGKEMYSFPKIINLKHCMQDFLQDINEIEDKHFLSQNLVNLFTDKKPHGLSQQEKAGRLIITIFIIPNFYIKVKKL